MEINNALLEKGVGLKLDQQFTFANLGLITSELPNVLSFIESDKFVEKLLTNENIRGVLVAPEVAKKINGEVTKLVCDDPRYYFYALYNYRALKTYVRKPSQIHPTAKIHPRAFVSDYNVEIGANVIVEPNATILPDVTLGADCLVGAGTVLGCDDAEIKRTSRGMLRVVHDGRLIIGDRVEIGAGCTIDKGFSFQDTVIGEDTKIANTTYIGHSVQIGKRCLLLCCTILGSSVVEDNARINPKAIISNQIRIGEGATVSLGAVVVSSVPRNGHVSGNFAVDHRKFLYHYSRTFGPL